MFNGHFQNHLDNHCPVSASQFLSNADKIGITAAGVVGAGIAAHAIIATGSKRKQVMDRIQRGKINIEQVDK